MTDTRTMLEETVARLFEERVPREVVEAAERGEWPRDLWRTVEENGLTKPHLSEAAGGAGGSWLDSYVILRETGRRSVPLPIGETILAGWLLEQAGLEVPAGPLTVLTRRVPPEAVQDGRLSLRCERVPWGGEVERAVFIAPAEGGVAVGLVGTEGSVRSRGENLAREPRDELVFENATVLATGTAKLRDDVRLLYGALVRAAQMAGALESALEMSVRYAGERVQFGRPIAKFQAIQQNLARLAGESVALGTAAEAAFRAAGRADSSEEPFDPSFEIGVAKVRAGDAVDVATGIAHQVHGAIGFTYEHGLHFVTRRLWSWRAEFGTTTEWARRLGRLALQAEPEALWPFLTSR